MQIEEKQYDHDILAIEVIAYTDMICERHNWNEVDLSANQKTLDNLKHQIAEMECVFALEELTIYGQRIKMDMVKYYNINFYINDAPDNKITWNEHLENNNHECRMVWMEDLRYCARPLSVNIDLATTNIGHHAYTDNILEQIKPYIDPNLKLFKE